MEGKIETTITNGRVATRLIYIPKHVDDLGFKHNCKLRFTVAVNTGFLDNVEYCRITAFGRIAEYCCSHLSKGRLLHSLTAKQWSSFENVEKDGIPILHPRNGKPIIIKYTHYTLLKKPLLGAETKEHVADDIARGIRPEKWDNSLHSDHFLWIEMLKKREKIIYKEGDKTFGHAIVQCTV